MNSRNLYGVCWSPSGVQPEYVEAPKTTSTNNMVEEATDDTQLTNAQKAARTKALRKVQRDAEKELEEDGGTRKKQKENPSTSDTVGECCSER